MRSYTAKGRELAEEAKKRRKEVMAKMLDELRTEKEEMIKKREGMKLLYKEMPEDNPEKYTTYLKIRKIEDDLKAEYYKLVEVREMD
jgi:DNA-binding MarR family transcriptional regulator